jgi:hypothetical protein
MKRSLVRCSAGLPLGLTAVGSGEALFSHLSCSPPAHSKPNHLRNTLKSEFTTGPANVIADLPQSVSAVAGAVRHRETAKEEAV